MDHDAPFIGMGHNPEGPDLPVGLGMRIAQVPEAITAFGEMSEAEKEDVVRYIQGGTTGEEAQLRMDTAVEHLKMSDISFFKTHA